MIIRLFFLSALQVVVGSCLNVLVYSPLFAASHTNFMARLADTLTEAGHNVTFFTPVVDEARRNQLGVQLTKDVLVLEQDEEVRNKKITIDNMMGVFWTMDVTSSNVHRILETLHQQSTLLCGNVFRNQEVIEELRKRKFDVALAEPLLTCGLALFRHLGIEKVIISSSCVNYDILIPAIGEPEETSYLPAMSSQSMDVMSFYERLENHQIFHKTREAYAAMFDDEMNVYRKYLGADFPDWRQLVSDASLHFVNAIPFLDFPRPSIQKTIPIGGISVDIERIEAETLSEEWNRILDSRTKSMFISFGSLARSSEMPDNFKQNLLSAFRAHSNVTFIWKYESEDVSFADGVDNVVFVKWAPQTALLNDVRLSAFLTHGGLGSTNEVAHLGKPAIMVPIFADQSRNSNMLARHQMAIVLHKSELGDRRKVLSAFHSILYDDSYQKNATLVADMLRNRPTSPRDTVVKYVEFVARYGPFEHMTPHSLKMTWFQRHNYDVLLYLSLGYFVTIILVLAVLRFICRNSSLKFVSISKKLQ